MQLTLTSPSTLMVVRQRLELPKTNPPTESYVVFDATFGEGRVGTRATTATGRHNTGTQSQALCCPPKPDLSSKASSLSCVAGRQPFFENGIEDRTTTGSHFIAARGQLLGTFQVASIATAQEESELP
jgi:hypothetical protein